MRHVRHIAHIVYAAIALHASVFVTDRMKDAYADVAVDHVIHIAESFAHVTKGE